MARRESDHENAPLPAHVFQIMLSLLAADAHGYAIIQDVAERTGGRLELGTSTLYAVLTRLERIGWAEVVDGPAEVTDGRRKYYRLSASGREAVRAEARRIHELDRLLREPGLAERIGLASEADSR